MMTLRMVRMRRMTTMVLKEWFTMCGSLDDFDDYYEDENYDDDEDEEDDYNGTHGVVYNV